MLKFLPTLAAASVIATSVFAQTTQPAAPSMPAPAPSTTEKSMTPPATMAPPVASSGSVTLSDEQAKAWINKVVYSSDNKNLGEVAAFARDQSGKVTEMHADIGGFLGIGETRIRLMPAQFKLDTDRVVLSLTAEQAKALPRITKN